MTAFTAVRRVPAPSLGRDVSVLGFGCASLGSRISERHGLNALAEAHERGVSWYDVAPSYGDGLAEGILGRFLKRRRDDVVVCTKVGLAPSRNKSPLAWAKPLARAAVKAVPMLRKSITSLAPAARKPPLEPAFIIDSVEASLRRLGCEVIDVLALHEPNASECVDPANLEALEGLKRRGLVRAISVAGGLDAANAALQGSTAFALAQLANNPYEPLLKGLRPPPGRAPFMVTHSALGFAGAFEALSAALARDLTIRRHLADLGYGGGDRDMLAAVLLDYALATNGDGVVLCSMFGDRHRAANCDRAASACPDAAVVQLLDEIVGQGGAPLTSEVLT